MAIDPSTPAQPAAGDPDLHIALGRLAQNDADPAADAAVRKWIAGRASGVFVWSRCRDLALEDVVSAAHATVLSKARDGTLPILGEPLGGKDRGYVNSIVRSRFLDARRARQRQAGDCAPSQVTIDREFGQHTLDQLVASSVLSEPEFARAFPDALEVLVLAAKAVIDGIQALPAQLSGPADKNRDPAPLRLWVKRVFRLRAALRKGPMAALSGQPLRDVRKFLIGLDMLRDLLPNNPQPADPTDMEFSEIEHAIGALQSTGILRRIAIDAGAQGQTEAQQIDHIHAMLRLKLGHSSVEAALGLTPSDAEYVRRRDALYSRHRHVRLRIAKKLAWLRQRALVNADDAEDIEALLRFLLRR